MIFSCNRFAIIPHMCNECKRYIWLESYRRADVWKYDRFIMENICKQCLPKFLNMDITKTKPKRRTIMNITALCVYCKKNNSCTRCWKTSNKECPYFNQKTNADHIRSMSDEELAKYLFEIGYYEGWPATKDALEWLQQPMEMIE